MVDAALNDRSAIPPGFEQVEGQSRFGRFLGPFYEAQPELDDGSRDYAFVWNGSSWGVGMLLADSESLLAVLLQLMWLAVMVLTLWFCILRWLPTIVLKAQE